MLKSDINADDLQQAATNTDSSDTFSELMNVYRYTGWHTVKTRARTEKKVRLWLEEQLVSLTDFLPDKVLIPVQEARGSVGPIGIVFIKVREGGMESIRDIFSRQQMLRVGIFSIKPVIDHHVYDMMSHSGSSIDQYKSGDIVVLKSAENGLQYSVVDVSEDCSTIKLCTHLFGQKVIETYNVQDIMKCRNVVNK
jgi:hypothetical protein